MLQDIRADVAQFMQLFYFTRNHVRSIFLRKIQNVRFVGNLILNIQKKEFF